MVYQDQPAAMAAELYSCDSLFVSFTMDSTLFVISFSFFCHVIEAFHVKDQSCMPYNTEMKVVDLNDQCWWWKLKDEHAYKGNLHNLSFIQVFPVAVVKPVSVRLSHRGTWLWIAHHALQQRKLSGNSVLPSHCHTTRPLHRFLLRMLSRVALAATHVYVVAIHIPSQ